MISRHLLGLTTNTSRHILSDVHITFDICVETFGRFKDEHTQHDAARRGHRRGRHRSRHSGRVRGRRRRRRRRRRERHPHVVAQRDLRSAARSLGGGRGGVRGGQPGRHRRADRLSERGVAAHPHPERARGRRPTRPLPGLARWRTARPGRQRLPHASRRRDPRHDLERRCDDQPVAGRRRDLWCPVHIRHRGILVQHRPVHGRRGGGARHVRRAGGLGRRTP